MNSDADIDWIYFEMRWQEGQAGEANIVRYYDSNIIGVAYVEDKKLRERLIAAQNLNLMTSLLELKRKLS